MSASLQEVLDRLCEVEQTFQLLQYQADGWSAWPLVRFELSLLLTGLTFPHPPPAGRSGRALSALTGMPPLLRLRKARHLIKTYSSGLLDETGGRYRDIWFDDVMSAAGSVFKIEAPSGARFAERSRRALISCDLSSTTLEALAAVTAWRLPSTEIRHTARVFTNVIHDQLALRTTDEAWVIRRLQRFAAMKRVYASILGRVHPAFVLVADPGEHALVAAAKEQGSLVLELQHGIADASNASYAWPSTAKPYRTRMPIPDRVLLYGEHWRHELDRNGFWEESLRVVGSPRLDRYRHQAFERARDVCTIVFTTQGLEIGAVTQFLKTALQQAIAHTALRLFVKLHPLHDPDAAPYRDAFAPFGDRVVVLPANEGPSTFELLQRAHLHVSIASASHYEALGLGVPTVVLPFSTHDVVLPLVRAGHASLARTPEEFAQLIRTWRNLKIPAAIGDYYFRPGALRNVLREIGLDSAAELSRFVHR